MTIESLPSESILNETTPQPQQYKLKAWKHTLIRCCTVTSCIISKEIFFFHFISVVFVVDISF